MYGAAHRLVYSGIRGNIKGNTVYAKDKTVSDVRDGDQCSQHIRPMDLLSFC